MLVAELGPESVAPKDSVVQARPHVFRVSISPEGQRADDRRQGLKEVRTP